MASVCPSCKYSYYENGSYIDICQLLKDKVIEAGGCSGENWKYFESKNPFLVEEDMEIE
jgi:hypothetical protein